MKLIVSEQAQRQIRQTAQYLQWRNGTGSMRKFIAALHRVQLLLRKNPKLGPAEPIAGRPAAQLSQHGGDAIQHNYLLHRG